MSDDQRRESPCVSCSGSGSVVYWSNPAGDETETCSTCDGTGERPPPGARLAKLRAESERAMKDLGKKIDAIRFASPCAKCQCDECVRERSEIVIHISHLSRRMYALEDAVLQTSVPNAQESQEK